MLTTQTALLTALILLPAVFSIILIHIIFAITNNIKSKQTKFKKLKVFSLDADRGLAEQGYLWLSILTPLIYFLVFGYFSWRDYAPALNEQGFSKFIEISTLPLALLSLSLPLSVLSARIHATHQTSTQIEATKHKNNLDSYYAHRKSMFEYFGALRKISYLEALTGDFYAHPRLHKRFFIDKGPENGTPDVNQEQFTDAIKTLKEIREHIHNTLIKDTEYLISAEQYIIASKKIIKLSKLLDLPAIYEDLLRKNQAYQLTPDKDSPEKDIEIITIGESKIELIAAYRYTRSFLRVLCEFAGQDVSFFDKNIINAIDKDETFHQPPYTTKHLKEIMNAAVLESRKIRTARVSLNKA
ncbi:hypothetical protein H7A76_31675 [Pseudomonas sp. MSSRFD41]|uniref:hypothetical protein n=1 Tax=Pseudomonas sp. MSSRFD41 TaxID=1310370 RepID=UPI0016398D2E|nr:hypothetical protein [Pseudomonas sp. MSSRFD41]MBC2660013.1 hypothetical protein [Pseudomonas sp. MSSRFD41]